MRPEPRIERQPREPSTDLGQTPIVRQRAELAQRALRHRGRSAPSGGSTNGKASMSPELQRMHLQDHGREVGALDLGLGEGRAREVVLFRIQPDRDAGADASAAPARWLALACEIFSMGRRCSRLRC
jgi:hypothetical protein